MTLLIDTTLLADQRWEKTISYGWEKKISTVMIICCCEINRADVWFFYLIGTISHGEFAEINRRLLWSYKLITFSVKTFLCHQKGIKMQLQMLIGAYYNVLHYKNVRSFLSLKTRLQQIRRKEIIFKSPNKKKNSLS